MLSLKRTAQAVVRGARRLVTSGRFETHAARARRDLARGTVPWRGPAVFNLSIDFELCWGNGNLDGTDILSSQRLAWSRRVTENFHGFLDVLQEYRLPATWAVLARIAEPRGIPQVRFAPRWARRDWYAFEEETRLEPALWDGRPYLAAIRNAVPAHEVMSHGFAHIDYGDDACSEAVAREDMVMSRRVLESHGFHPTGFVYPCNSVGHRELLRDVGYPIARGPDADWHLDDSPVPMTPRGFWISPAMISAREMCSIVRDGARLRSFVHPWFHLHEPDVRHRDIENFFRPVLETVLELRESGRLEVLSFEQIGERLAPHRAG